MRTILFCLALTACSTALAGPDSSDVRNVGAFHGLEIRSVIDADVEIGPTTRVELRGPSDELAKIDTHVTGGVLVIDMPSHTRITTKLHATIVTPDLSSLRVSGVGNVHVTKLAAKALDVAVSGVGDIDLAGTADSLHVSLSGTGDIGAKNLATKSTTVAVSGTGDATVRASQEVDATVSGVGHVTVLGKPASVKRHVSGLGGIHVE
jgi:hypothetical protein